MRLRAFDWAGLGALISFATVLAVDLPHLRWVGEEIDLRLTPEALDAGFREGVQWHSIYRDDRKVGFVRSTRRRQVDGFELTTHTRWRSGPGGGLATPIGGDPGGVELDVRAALDADWTLREFEAIAQSPVTRLEARGFVRDASLVVEIDGPLARTLQLPLDRAPAFDFSVTPLLMRRDLAEGTRVRFEIFDPLTMSPRPVELEYLGREPLVVMGETVSAHHLRQRVAGQVLESWVNDLGEVYREQLPGGLVSIRESEAEATFFVPTEGERDP